MAHDTGNDSSVAQDQALTIHDLRPNMMLNGRVTKTDLYGAFVDIGIGRDALIHISRIRRGPVNRVDEVLSEGDEVTVWIAKVDSQSGRVSLTMIKPLDVPWSNLRKGDVYSGRVTRLEQYGAFVEIGAERPGLIHVSEMGEERIRPSELFSLEQEVAVRILDFDRRKKRIDLGLAREDEAADAEGEEEAEEPAATAMEMALRRAMEDTEEPITFRAKKGQGSRGRVRPTQDEILSRTLRNRKS